MPQLTQDGYDLLDVVAWHRYLTLLQARAWCGETTAKPYGGACYDLLLRLERQGLVESGKIEARGVNIYFATRQGLDLISLKHRREYMPSGDVAVGMDYRHTWCVNEIGIAFLRAAQERGDDFGPHYLEHEILMRQGTGRNRVIADGILQYVGPHLFPKSTGMDFPCAIVEMDRTAMPVRLTDRLRAYAEIKRKPTLWKRVLSDGWPTILFVISADPRKDGKRIRKCGEKNWAGDPAQSAARCARLVAYVADRAKDEKGLRDLDVLFCSLPALVAQGPFGAIWRRPGHPEPLDWLGKPALQVVGERKAGLQ